MKGFITFLFVMFIFFSQGQSKDIKDSAKNMTINGLKEGAWLEYLNDMGDITTTKTERYRICFYRAGKLDGVVREYFVLPGVTYLERKTTYSNGILNGELIIYYEDGVIKSQDNYSNGIAEGEWREYYDTVTEYFVKSLNNVKTIKHPTHQLEEDCFYENGKPIGTWTEYWENGNVKDIYSFTKGKKDGVEKYYKESGKLDWVQFYTNGFLDPRKAKLYDKNGNPK